MSDQIIYQDPKTKVTLSKTEVIAMQDNYRAGSIGVDVIRVSRAAMNEIVRGYERERQQERETKP
jgi:hypothetical protein